jgi:endo-1,4-beta-xylanase
VCVVSVTLLTSACSSSISYAPPELSRPASARTDAAVMARGFEAATMTGATDVYDDRSAPDVSVVQLAPGDVLSQKFVSVTSSIGELTWKSGCGKPQRVTISIGSKRVASAVSSTAKWHTTSFKLKLRPGAHVVRLATGPTTACPPPSVDRIDFVPAVAADRVTLGAALRASLIEHDSTYRSAFLEHFGSLTPENELKMDFVEQKRGQFSFAAADQLIDLAITHHKQVRGHVLVWGQALPDWVTSPSVPWTASSLRAVMKQYITRVMQHFGSRIKTWDVVNEAFTAEGTLVPNLWYSVIGPSYIADAFRFAHEADPHASLFYNDWGMEWPGAKLNAVLSLVSQLRRDGVRIDGIGLQDHVSLESFPTQAQFHSSLAQIAAAGLKVEITEMTVSTAGFSGTKAQALALQAEIYRAHATACWDVEACSRLTVWGVYDGVTYLGPAASPVLFNAKFRAKPAYGAVVSALHLQ